MGKKKVKKSKTPTRKLSSNKRAIQQKKKYLAEWDVIFERMKSFKADYNKTTVPKDFPDQQLYRWFRTQKKIYNHPTQKMPKEHLEKLNSINFYFGDGHREREEKLENKWIALLKEALDNGEKVPTNHRYKYKGKGLGTFLVGVKQDNKKGKKLEARRKIEALGFELDAMSRDPQIFFLRYLHQLENNKKKTKQHFQSRFNQHILPRAEEVPADVREQINAVWRERYNEERTWHKIRKYKTADDFVNDFVSDLVNDKDRSFKHYKARFNHSLLPRKDMFNAEQRKRVENAWSSFYKTKLDWTKEIKKYTPDFTSLAFLNDLKDPTYSATLERFESRFERGIVYKKAALTNERIKEIEKAWKKRFNKEIDWDKCLSKHNPEKNAQAFFDELIMDEKASKSVYVSKLKDVSLDKKHLSDQIINKINSLWKLRFNEEIKWYPQKINNIKNPIVDKVTLWKRFRYSAKINPKEKWLTGPKDMGKLYTWVKRLKDNKYAMARVALNFSEEELKEMKREGFLVDLKLARKAKEFGVAE